MTIPADYAVFAFIGLFMLYRASEQRQQQLTGNRSNWGRREPTFYAVVLPFALMLGTAIFERLSLNKAVAWPFPALGAVLLAAGTFFRVRGLRDLGNAFSPYSRVAEGQQLVDTGLYRHIRHPLYVGTILLFLAPPIFVAARFAWVFVVIGLIGTFARIRKEEAMLERGLPGYAEYKKRTAALVPGVY